VKREEIFEQGLISERVKRRREGGKGRKEGKEGRKEERTFFGKGMIGRT